MSAKQLILQAINRMPDDLDFREAEEEIASLAARGGHGSRLAAECSKLSIEEEQRIADEGLPACAAAWPR